jgi:hypothetical protein
LVVEAFIETSSNGNAQCSSVARGLPMYRQEADNYFTLHLQICHRNGFQANPMKID